MRLSGWKRIGIVVSVVWFIAVGGYVWVDGNNRNADFYASSLRMCDAAADIEDESLSYIKNDAEREKKYNEIMDHHRACDADAAKFLGRQIDEAWKGIPLLLAVDLATVVIGWLLAWFVVAVGRWIRHGFVSA